MSTRILVLLTNQQYGDGDEALIGVMALNIIDEGQRPFFFYGQSYNGGGALEAYVASVLFRFLEPSYLVLKLQGLVFSALTLIMGFYLLNGHFSLRSANLFALLYTFGVNVFSVWNLKINGGYVETPFFIIAFICLCYAYIFGKKQGLGIPIAMGILCGIAVWVHDFIIPFILAMIIALYLFNKAFFLTKRFLLFVLCFVISLIPLWVYNIKNCYSYLHHQIFGSPFEKATIALLNRFFPSCEYATSTSSRLNEGIVSNVGSYASSFVKFFGHTVSSKLYLVILILSIAWLIYICRNSILPWIRALVPLSKYNLQIRNQPKEMLLLLFLSINMGAYLLRGVGDIRYFLFTYILLLLLMAISLDKIGGRKGRSLSKGRHLLAIAAVVLLLIGGYHLINVAKTENRGLGELTQFLEENGIKAVYVDGYMAWGIIFESDKRIMASCDRIGLCDHRYPKYDDVVRNSEGFAYILVENSKIEREFLRFAQSNSISFQKKGLSIDFFENQPQTIELDVHEINVYFDLSEAIRPVQFISNPTWDDGFE